jgi:hypothetical protein
VRKNHSRHRKKVAVKFCGGCNPGFDRVEYYRKIRAAAGDSILWAGPAEGGFDTLLLIEGCETACAEEDLVSLAGREVVSLKNDGLAPEEVVKRLLGGS